MVWVIVVSLTGSESSAEHLPFGNFINVMLQTKDPFVKRACTIGTITMLSFYGCFVIARLPDDVSDCPLLEDNRTYQMGVYGDWAASLSLS